MLIKRETFQLLRFNSDYRVCGEDVELCLALRDKLEMDVMYCPQFSGEHAGEATRSQKEGQSGNSEDLTRMRALHERFLNTASNDQLRMELAASVAEADALRSKIKRESEDANHWEAQAHALQLTRLKLTQKLKQAKKRA